MLSKKMGLFDSPIHLIRYFLNCRFLPNTFSYIECKPLFLPAHKRRSSCNTPWYPPTVMNRPIIPQRSPFFNTESQEQNLCLPISTIKGRDQIHPLVAVSGLK